MRYQRTAPTSVLTSRSIGQLWPKGEGRAAARAGRLPVSCRSTPSPRATHALDAVVARAGGVLAGTTDGRSRVHYGSAAGELAACVSGVGLGDRSELVKLQLERPAARRSCAAVRDLTGSALAPGGAIRTGAGVVVRGGPGAGPRPVSEPAGGDRLLGRIRPLAARHPALRDPRLTEDVDARSRSWAARPAHGPGAAGRLRRVRRPARPTPVTAIRSAAPTPCWLLQSDHRALAVMSHADAAAAWQAIHRRRPRPSGICAVGQEALARYSLLARTHPEL